MRAILEKWVPADQPKMDQFQIFWMFSIWNQNLARVNIIFESAGSQRFPSWYRPYSPNPYKFYMNIFLFFKYRAKFQIQLNRLSNNWNILKILHIFGPWPKWPWVGPKKILDIFFCPNKSIKFGPIPCPVAEITDGLLLMEWQDT